MRLGSAVPAGGRGWQQSSRRSGRKQLYLYCKALNIQTTSVDASPETCSPCSNLLQVSWLECSVGACKKVMCSSAAGTANLPVLQAAPDLDMCTVAAAAAVAVMRLRKCRARLQLHVGWLPRATLNLSPPGSCPTTNEEGPGRCSTYKLLPLLLGWAS